MSLTETLSRVRSLDREAVETLGAASLAFAVMVGKMSLPLPLGIAAELRFAPTLLGAVCLAPALASLRLDVRQWSFAALFGVLLCYLFARGLGGGEAAIAKQVDLVYLAIQAALVVAIAALANARIAAALSIIGVAGLYFCVAVANQWLDTHNNFGLGWGAPGSAITFNRIMFAAFASALCLSLHKPLRPWFLALAALFLFASWASIQKSAIAGSIVAIGFAMFLLLWSMRWRETGHVAAIVVVATLAMAPTFGGKLINRTVAAVDLSEKGRWPGSAKETTQSVGGGNYQHSTKYDFDYERAAAPSELHVATNYCVYERRVDDRDTADIVCRDGSMADRSERLVMWAEALSDFTSAPLFGVGLGGYEAILIVLDGLRPVAYPYPHNIVLELAAETGLVGVMLYGLAVLVVLMLAAASPASLVIKAYVGTFAVFLFIATMLGGDFYDSRMFWLAAMMLAFWRPMSGPTT